jgi:hypothetical protein
MKTDGDLPCGQECDDENKRLQPDKYLQDFTMPPGRERLLLKQRQDLLLALQKHFLVLHNVIKGQLILFDGLLVCLNSNLIAKDSLLVL